MAGKGRALTFDTPGAGYVTRQKPGSGQALGESLRMPGSGPAGVEAPSLDQTEKLLPQPQELLACGFLIANEEPIMSST